MVEVLKEILAVFILTSPVWLFAIIHFCGYIGTNFRYSRIYKLYYLHIEDMLFYKDKNIELIYGHTKDGVVSITWFEHKWKLTLKGNYLEYLDITYGVNPFKNYWYNKITKLISSKKIYSYYEYMEYRNVIYKIEQRNLLLNKILNS